MRGKITDIDSDTVVVAYDNGERYWHFRFRFDVDPMIGDIVERVKSTDNIDLRFKVLYRSPLSWKEYGF